MMPLLLTKISGPFSSAGFSKNGSFFATKSQSLYEFMRVDLLFGTTDYEQTLVDWSSAEPTVTFSTATKLPGDMVVWQDSETSKEFAVAMKGQLVFVVDVISGQSWELTAPASLGLATAGTFGSA